MALCLCSQVRSPVVACLLGSQIYRTAAKHADTEVDKELEQDYFDKAKKFDQHAGRIIDECYKIDKNLAINIFESPSVVYFNLIPLQLALSAGCRKFLAADTVQHYCHYKWYEHIDSDQKLLRMSVRTWVLVSALIIPLVPVLSLFLPSIKDKEVIFFILFLGLFSFVLLVDYFPLNIYGETRSGIQNLLIPSTEISLHICFWGLIIDEIYQWVKHQRKEQDYSGDVRNISDIFGIIFYLIGFITRFIVLETAFIVSKISMCMALIFWSIRLLHLFAAYESLGPTLVMIFKMTQQAMLIFVCFILIFLFSFSITSVSLLTTTSQVTWIYTDDGQLFNATVTGKGSGTEMWNWQLLRDVTTWGIWKVFGQIDEPINNSVSTNDSYGAFVFIFAILFVMIANVLLLNVLIAMFKFSIFMQLYMMHILASPAIERQNNNLPPVAIKITQLMAREKQISGLYWKNYFITEEKQKQTNVDLKTMERKLEKIYDTIIHNNQPAEQLEPDFVRGLMKLYYDHPEEAPPITINTQRVVPHGNQLINGFEEEFGLDEQQLPVPRGSRQRSLTRHSSSSTEMLTTSPRDNAPRSRSRHALLIEENNSKPPNVRIITKVLQRQRK
ncbi:unnamed protein product [Didymodactylos carnosus]|uniref:Ion transport domain-containing protein n=1 Tax=Didymodactylos carnosus TaxID=1234261 RepID=A0A815AHK1_9BILA|nr:unnamed protein product [Didymodactylos carnosus]CAF1255935.1 unnamed protein product [Didymodactylos carnosus]CAF3832644.1 unnamed protein product [Didymodactylos carnosus]CAF4028384.1 unnamed protein product [Didymodactylos carnosus]